MCMLDGWRPRAHPTPKQGLVLIRTHGVLHDQDAVQHLDLLLLESLI